MHWLDIMHSAEAQQELLMFYDRKQRKRHYSYVARLYCLAVSIALVVLFIM